MSLCCLCCFQVDSPHVLTYVCEQPDMGGGVQLLAGACRAAVLCVVRFTPVQA